MNSDEFIINTVQKIPDVPGEETEERQDWIECEDGLTDESIDGVPFSNHKECYEHKILETKLKIAESTEFNIAATSDCNTFSNFDDIFQGCLPRLLLTVQGKDPKLGTVDTFDELKLVCEKKSNTPKINVPGSLLSAPIYILGHYASFGEYISNLYVNNELPDADIEVEGRHFLAHRTVLCCYSDYLEKLLLRNTQKRIPVAIKFVGISSEAFANFLEFIYTGYLRLQPSYVLDMFTIAEMLGIKALRNMLGSKGELLDLQQALQLLLQHGKTCSTQLYQHCLNRITRQFEAASRIVGFLDMNVDLFCYFLESDDLEIASEFDVFQIALRWIVHGAHDRLRHACRIMNLVRFPHMSRNEMFRCTNETNLFQENEDLRLLLIMSVWYVTALKLQRSDPLDVTIPLPRRGYKSTHLSVASSPDSYTPPEHVLDINQSSFPNKPVSTHSPRHAKPVLLPADNHVVRRTGVITKTKVKSPTRYAKPILVPQNDGDASHEPETETLRKPTSPARFAKPVMWPSPPPKHEEPNTSRPVPSRFAKPIIWPPPKPFEDKVYHESLVSDTNPAISTLPMNAQRMFWNGKPPKPISPQLSPVRHAKPILVPTPPSSTQPSPMSAFPDTYDDHYMTSPMHTSPQLSPARHAKPVLVPTPPNSKQQSPIFVLCPDQAMTSSLPASDELDDDDTPEEVVTTPPVLTYLTQHVPSPAPTYHKQHVADLVSQFSAKFSSTTASCCPHPVTPGHYAQPLTRPGESDRLHVPRDTVDQSTTVDYRRPTAVEIFIIGGFCDDLHSQKENDGDVTSTRWMRYCNLPAPRKNFAVAMVARKIYLIGGCDPTKCSNSHSATNTMFRMDYDSKIWRKMTPMWQCRESHCACAIDNLIYVLGGLDNTHTPLYSVECYNVHTDVWYNISTMPEPRFAASVTSMNGKCYIAGGLTRVGHDSSLKSLDTMYCFDPQTNRWEKKCSLRTPVCYSSLVNVEGSMYICGGAIVTYLDSNEVVLNSTASVDKYDADFDVWEPMTEMMVPRHSAAVAVAGSRLIVIGGKNSTTERFLRSTECLDTHNVEWATRSVDLPFPARSISCVVCPMYGNT